MLQQIQLKDAESNFTELVRKSLAGDEFVIMIDGRPALRLIPFREKNIPEGWELPRDRW